MHARLTSASAVRVCVRVRAQGGKPAGRLVFDCEMEEFSEVAVTFKEVQGAQ